MDGAMNSQLPMVLPLTISDRQNCERDTDIPSRPEDIVLGRTFNGVSSIDIEHPIEENLSCNNTREDEKIDNDEEDGEDESPPQSFSCVDYLEIMHEEMLNPDINHTSESDGQEENSSLTCKQTQCSFSTTDMEAYLKHEYEHVDGKCYQCDVCHMKFSMFSQMRNHRMSHLSHRPYKCRLCSKEFVRKDILVEHLVKQHSKQRPYRCPFCPKHFKLRPQLKLHLSNEHSAAVLIKTCKLCGFKADSPNAFRSHFAICYLKRSRHISESNGGNNMPQLQCASSDVGAIDLATVSQNFSYVPVHYAPYTIVTGESSSSLPGPSDLTQILSLRTSKPAECIISAGKPDKQYIAEPTEPANPTRISSLASSTTTTSPTASNVIEPQNLAMNNIRLLVKSEPSEPPREDSQNSNGLPTSTMDLSATNVVETSYNFNDMGCRQTSSDAFIKIKAACSSHEESNVERCNSPPTDSRCKSQNGHSSRCYMLPRLKCIASRVMSNRCLVSQTRHIQRCNSCGKRERHSDSDSQTENEQVHPGQQPPSKKSCHDKATATDLSRNSSTCLGHSSSTDHHSTSVPQASVHNAAEPSDDNKCNLSPKKAGCSSFSCPYCEIVFPDQTLYFLHRSLHSEAHPWKCNLCGKYFKDKYEFNSHIISQSHH